MYNNRRNNYNQYTQGYTAPIEGANMVYQPVYDPSETDRMVQLLQQRQQRFDVGRQQSNEFATQVGSMQTYAPDMLNQRAEEFNNKVQDVVNKQYRGDWGLAANDVASMIAKEKGDPFYKAISYQNQQAERQQKFVDQKRGLGENYVIQQSPKQVDLQEALNSGNYMNALEFKGINTPNYDALGYDIAKRIPSNITDQLLAGLSDEEQKSKAIAYLGAGNIDGFFKTVKTESNQANLAAAKEQMVNSFYDQAREPLEAEIRSENPKLTQEEVTAKARAKAEKHIENNVQQVKFSKTDKTLDSFIDEKVALSKADGEAYAGNPMYTPGYETPQVNYNEKADEIFGTDKGKFDLTNYDFKGTFESIANDSKRIAEINAKLNETETKHTSINGVGGSTKVNKVTGEERDKLNKELTALNRKNNVAKTTMDKATNFKINGKNIFENIDEYEANYGSPYELKEINGELVEVPITDPNARAKFIVDKIQKEHNKDSKFLTLDKVELNKKLQDSWEKGIFNDKVYSHQGFGKDGNPKYEESSMGNFDLNNKWFNIKDRSKMQVTSINPRNGRLVAQDPSGNKVEFYPTSNAAQFGSRIEKLNKNLKTNGYDYNNVNLSIKMYDPTREVIGSPGAISEYTMTVPEAYRDRVKEVVKRGNKREIEALYIELDNKGVISEPTESYISKNVYRNAGAVGMLNQGSIDN